MMSKPEEQMVYRVGIVRQDMPEPLYVSTVGSVEEARREHIKYNQEWSLSVEEKRPYQVPDMMRSFLPGLIIEIKVDEVPYSTYSRQNSLYEQQLKSMGTTGFMSNNFQMK